jgi:hypothetical protein
MYSILQTAKLNGVNPEAYLTDTLSQIAAGHCEEFGMGQFPLVEIAS